LTWEKTDLYDFGVNFSAFKNRLNFEADIYASYTHDLLLTVRTVKSTGFSSRYSNLGETTNKGVEFTLSTKNIARRNFYWNTTFTLSHNKQMVVDIGNEEYVSAQNAYSSGYMMYGYKSGYPLNSLWGFQYAGVWHSQEELDRNNYTNTYASPSYYNLGFAKYVDQNKDGVLSEDDLIYLGTADPDIYGGLQNTFGYKKWKLSFYLSYSLGGKIYNYAELFLGSRGANQFRSMLGAWHPERNPESDLPRAYSETVLLPSTLQVHDASYLRLKTITLSRDFSFKGNKFFRSMTCSISGDNLWLLTKYNGYDPDVNTSGTSSVLRRIDNGAYPRASKLVFSVLFRY